MPVRALMIGPSLRPWARLVAEQSIVPLELDVAPSYRDEDVCPLLPDVDIAITSHWSPAMGPAARRLRFIQMPGAGWDKLDAEAIPEGVLVANCYEHEWGIAEYTMMMCLVLARELLPANQAIRQADWRYMFAAGHPLYPELGGQTLGIVGLGRIGRAVAELAGAFRMRRIGLDANRVSAEQRRTLGLEWVGGPDDLPRLFGESDFVVFAIPLSENTRGWIGARELSWLKSSAFLINPARAEIFDERALYEALRDRSVRGAALDPWWHYPKLDECVAPSEFPFAVLDNVVMTPHYSGSTDKTVERRMQVVVDNLNRYFRGEPVVNIVAELSRHQAREAVAR